MENLPAFQAHVERLFAPLRPGLAYVRTMEFVTEDFEEIEDTSDLSPSMLERARAQGILCVDIVEEEILIQIRLDAHRFMEQNGVQPGWNAANADELEMNLEGFCDSNSGIWNSTHFPEYKARNPGDLDEAGLAYVRSFVGSALIALPSHLEGGDESIYYDSDETVQGEENGV